MPLTRALSLGDVTIPGVHPKLGSFLELDLPHKAGLVDVRILGGSIEASRVNRVNTDEKAAVIGAPVVDPSGFGMTCNWSNCLDLLKQATASCTWIVVSKPKTAASPGDASLACTMLSNKTYVGQPAVQVGDQLFWHQTPAANSVTEYNNSVHTNSRGAAGFDPTKWAVAVRYVDAAAGTHRAGARQGGALQWSGAVGVLPGPRRTNGSDRTLRIGALATNGDSGEKANCDIGLVVIFNTALTETQIAENVEYISQWLATGFGITDV